MLTHLFFEKGTKGAVPYIFEGYSKVNNKYLKLYDPKQELKHIIYFDVINLYDYAMPKFFLRSCFKFIDPKDFG